ncbi:hypothetical protein JXQ70_10080 [bacterium]|nr:hypothetical protein [bacterium]
MDWIPKTKPHLDLNDVDLSEEEGYVLSRIDGCSTVQDLKHVTGLSLESIETVLARLEQAQLIFPRSRRPACHTASDKRDFPEQQDDALHSGPSSDHTQIEQVDGRDEQEADRSEGEVQSRNYRMLFETKFHPLENEEREKLAHSVTGSDLCALCYDPDAEVIKALFENSQFGLTQARLIAAHHRNPVGLDKLAYHLNFLQDEAVQRFLLRNIQTSTFLLDRMTVRKSLLQLYQLIVSGDVAEKIKRQIHQLLRRKFQNSSGDEAAALIFKTEGRCLTMLTGIPLNGKTIARLCGHTYTSLFLIQNLARWPTTPPKVLHYLFRQPIANRSVQVRNLILQHPNCPSQLKS